MVYPSEEVPPITAKHSCSLGATKTTQALPTLTSLMKQNIHNNSDFPIFFTVVFFSLKLKMSIRLAQCVHSLRLMYTHFLLGKFPKGPELALAFDATPTISNGYRYGILKLK